MSERQSHADAPSTPSAGKSRGDSGTSHADATSWSPATNGDHADATGTWVGIEVQAAQPSTDRQSPEFEELKTQVHRRLLERMNLDTLGAPRYRAAPRGSAIGDTRAARPAGHAAQSRRAQRTRGAGPQRGLRPRAPGALAAGCLDLGHPGQHLRSGFYRARRASRGDPGQVPRRPAPATGHRPDRLGSGPADRRLFAYGRRASGGRFASQRHHPAAGDRRTASIDPEVPARRLVRRGPDPGQVY